MNISLALRVRHYLALRGSSWVRMYRGIVGTRSRGWLCKAHLTRPSLLRRGVQLSVFALIVTLLTGLTQATPVPSVTGVATETYSLGAPCSTLTDIREGTCNLKVDAIKRNAGQPKPFTERWTK